MKIVFLLSFIISGFTYAYGQEVKIGIDENGNLLGETIVLIQNKTASQIYNSSFEWVSYTFKNTESVVQSKIENKMIRISGLSKSIFGPYMGSYLDLKYLIQIDIKDGKLKFKATDLEQVAQSAPFTKTPLAVLYKKNGELRSGNRYLEIKGKIDSELTRLIISLTKSIKGKSKTSDDDW